MTTEPKDRAKKGDAEADMRGLIPAQRSAPPREAVPPKFSYYAFISGIRREHPAMDPDSLTKQILADLPPEYVPVNPAALEQATRMMASNSITSPHNNNQRPFLRPVRDLDSSRSWKTAASRKQPWAAYLELPFHVIPGSKDWIRFGDVTLDDVRAGKQSRRKKITGLQTAVDALDEWEELFLKHGAQRIDDLPDDVLRERLWTGDTV